eukprot:3202905-Rhodomonas_salina.1
MVPKTRTAQYVNQCPFTVMYGKGAILGLRTDLRHANVINSLDHYWLRLADDNLKRPSIASVASLTKQSLKRITSVASLTKQSLESIGPVSN